MNTNINLDETLVTKAMKLGSIKTKKEVVHLALEEFVQRREQSKVIEFFGTVDFDEDYDYKKQRKVK